VTVISRSFSPALDDLAVRRQEVDLLSLADEALEDLLQGAFLAVAATSDPRLNDRIGRICAETGVLFNNAAGSPAMSPSIGRPGPPLSRRDQHPRKEPCRIALPAHETRE